MSRVTYKVVWPSGSCRYNRTVKEARWVFNNSPDPDADKDGLGAHGEYAQMAETLYKVYLTPDAFERSANNYGGYEMHKLDITPKRKATK